MEVGSQLGKVTRHWLHRSTRPGCWAALHLQPSSVQKAVLRMVVSCHGTVFKLCHIMGWPVPSTLSLSVTFWPHSARAIWSATSPMPPLSQRGLGPPAPHLCEIWPHSPATVKATWMVYPPMMISVPQKCRGEVHPPLSSSFRPQLYGSLFDLTLQLPSGSVHC